MSNNYTNDDANIKSNKADAQMGNNVCDSPETACPESNGTSNTVTVLAWDCDTPFFNGAITHILPSVPISYYSLYQRNPRKHSGDPHWRNFTHTSESYERAASKEYILLMRNFDYTKQHPNFHVIINFHRPMRIGDFSGIRNRAFGYLAKKNIRAYYVHEPTRSFWLHIHAITIFDGKEKELRDIVKESLMKAGLEEGRDFHVKVRPVKQTDEDFWRICHYILKFNGGYTYNRRKPRLFLKGLKIRKVGCIGRWFVKAKGKLWQEYCAEIKQKYGDSLPDNAPVALPEFRDFDGSQS